MSQNTLRIIAGKYRSRKLTFPDAAGLRPTGDRIRETLFNWLSPYITGAHCLDLFAGSGALGFEALSRGAESVTFIDNHAQSCDYLKQNIELLQAEQAQVLSMDALTALQKFSQHPAAPLSKPFDLVFLDPPFDSGLLPSLANTLEAANLLSSQCLIYVEQASSSSADLPSNWQVYKDKQSGKVHYQLYQRV